MTSLVHDDVIKYLTYLWVGVELTVRGGAEVAPVGVKPCNQDLAEELPEDSAPINTGLAETLGVDKLDTKLFTKVYKEKEAFCEVINTWSCDTATPPYLRLSPAQQRHPRRRGLV